MKNAIRSKMYVAEELCTLIDALIRDIENAERNIDEYNTYLEQEPNNDWYKQCALEYAQRKDAYCELLEKLNKLM